MAPETRATLKPGAPNSGAAFFWWLAVSAAGFLAILITLSAPQFLSGTIKPGETAGTDILAAKSDTIVDGLATRQLREQARQSALQVFKRDHSIDKQIVDKLSQELAQVSALQNGANLPLPQTLDLTPEEQVYLVESSDTVWQRIKAALNPRLLPQSQQGHGQPTSAGGEQIALVQSQQEIVRPRLEESIESKLRQGMSSSGHPHGRGSPRSVYQSGATSDSIAAVEKARLSYKKLPKGGANRDLLFLAVSINPDSWAKEKAEVEQATEKLLRLGPLFPDIPRADWERTALEFLPDRWSFKIRWTCARIVASVLKPNVVVDTEATKVKAEAAASAVRPVMKEFKAGQVLVPRGTIITAETAEMLNQLGVSRTIDWPLLLSLTLSLMAACTFFGLFLYTYAPKHLYAPSSIGLMFTVSVVAVGVSAFVGESYPQFVPLPAAALVSTVFFGPRVATGLLLMLLIFLKVDNLIDTSNWIALGSASAIAIGANIKQRHELMFRGFLIGVIQAFGFLCAVIVSHSVNSPAALGQQLFLQILGGLSSCIVAIGSLPFLEDMFGMVTPFRITELTAADQPLLRKLEENAPGTYQHSLAVANLAEAGARALGADITLVRAGSLYHDIGKMVRPRYFIENQLGDTNPHDEMSPEESRDRVLAHVTDGQALAQKFGLPRAVQDFIPQHQGTTLMAYFYHKACLRDGAEYVDSSFYRYPGPKPQSREAAIVMLADVSEAVTHSMNDPTQEEVEASMSTVFKARWDDGQFTESGLSGDELERVKKAFVRVWRTLHHERLKYPSTTTGRMAVAPDPPPRAQTASQPTRKGQE